jgi:hypothetical protein
MKFKLAGISGIVAAMLAVTSVQAIPISGSIYMGGEANLNSAGTQITSWPLVYVVADSGAFSSISAFTLVNMSSSAWIFSPSPGTPLNNLWNVGGFSFDFLGDTVSESGNFLDIYGYGTISSSNPAYQTTDFTWNLAAEDTASGPVDIVFSASTGASSGGGNTVPDGGLTLVLLGVALTGIELFRRKLCKA